MLKFYQFRLSTLLLAATLVAMACIIMVTRLEVARLKASRTLPIANASPIPPDVVAASVEQHLASHPLPTSVNDVRYSLNDDSFKVRYQWTDPTDGKQWSSDVTLKGDGYGEYTGCITNDKFLNAIQLQISPGGPTTGNVDRMWVGASTPSSLTDGG